jgi:hypothetical protein
LTFDVVGEKKVVMPSTVVQTMTNDLVYIKTSATVKQEAEITVKYKSRIVVNSTTKRALTRLGIGNLPALAYELIPYSFILDWFLPVGTYLGSLDAFSGISVAWTTKTVFYKRKTTYVRQFGGTLSGVITSNGIGMIVDEKVFCTRSLITPPPVGYPSFRSPLSAVHVADATALLTQLLR